jgi:hypothetical protein
VVKLFLSGRKRPIVSHETIGRGLVRSSVFSPVTGAWRACSRRQAILRKCLMDKDYSRAGGHISPGFLQMACICLLNRRMIA